MRVFTAPIQKVEPDDIDELCKEKYPEGSQVEFKSELPAKKNQRDPWIDGVNQIGDRARNEILAEVIAFANTHGGHVLLGIKETDGTPHRADEPNPIPRCHDLAEKLRLQARDCIEPQLPSIQTWGVPRGDDGSGVVLIRVPESQIAPHRLNVKGVSREAYFRRNDRKEKMSMREIQDLTLNRLHSSERLEKKFDALRSGFELDFKAWESSSSEKCVSFRASLLPQTSEIWNRRVYKPECWPILEGYTFRIQGKNDLKTSSPCDRGTDGRRILYGYRTLVTDSVPEHKVETRYDGSVNAVLNIAYPERAYLHQNWFLTHVANALLTAHLLRVKAGVPDAQYVFELEIIWSPNSCLTIRAVGPIEPNPIVTRYTFGSLEEIDDVLSTVYDDLMSAVGSSKLEPAKVEVEIRRSVLERFEEAGQ